MNERYIDVSYDEDNGLRLIDAFRAVWRSILVCLMAGIAAAGVFLAYAIFRMTPQYESSFTVYVSNRPADDQTGYYLGIGDLQASYSLAKSYAFIFESREMALSAVQRAGLTSYEKRAFDQQLVSTSIEQESPLVTVTVTADSPEDAYGLSEAILALIPDHISSISTGSFVSLVEPSQVPTKPSAPRKKIIAALGFILGFGIAVLVVVIRSDRDKLIWGKDELEDRFGVPAYVDVHNILPPAPQSGARVIGIMDAQDASLAAKDAVALAQSYAAQGARVLLMEGDANGAACRKLLGTLRATGLSEVLSGDMEPSDAIQYLADKGMDFIASGKSTRDFALKVGGAQMDALLTTLEGAYDCIVIAIPPVLSDGSALVLADRVQKAFLAVCAGRTRKPDIAEVLRRLKLADVNLGGFMYSESRNRTGRLIARHG